MNCYAANVALASGDGGALRASGDGGASAEVSPLVILLGMLNARALGGLGGLSLCLGGRGHEGDQGVADGSLHGVLCGTPQVISCSPRTSRAKDIAAAPNCLNCA